MPTSTSKAVWNGDLQSGNGQMVVGNNAYTGDFSFKSRFEEGAGTNPEELIAGAHAGCYAMQLSALLANADKNPTSVSASAKVTWRSSTTSRRSRRSPSRPSVWCPACRTRSSRSSPRRPTRPA